jgi:hypothetical protein
MASTITIVGAVAMKSLAATSGAMAENCGTHAPTLRVTPVAAAARSTGLGRLPMRTTTCGQALHDSTFQSASAGCPRRKKQLQPITPTSSVATPSGKFGYARVKARSISPSATSRNRRSLGLIHSST